MWVCLCMSAQTDQQRNCLNHLKIHLQHTHTHTHTDNGREEEWNLKNKWRENNNNVLTWIFQRAERPNEILRLG